ncbi:SDR family oxidoreductase [Promicromonospora sp. NPDC057488]|uniref:SDR family oxidoreductase n=1 Tax=Promicromonospora sp. NPDC057488 TaxID=3346147 RepID=UPI003671D4AB
MKNVLAVIGAGGMGEAVVRRLGSGRRVLIADLDVELLGRLERQLSGEGFDVTTQKVDVADRESMTATAEAAAELGAVHTAVHTAGLSPVQAPAEAILRVDMLGVAHFLDAFSAVIAPGGSGVVIASMAGMLSAGRLPAEVEVALATTPTDDLLGLQLLSDESFADAGAAYALSKRANQLRVQAAARVWGARGARINSVSPGVISTPMGQEELASESGTQMRRLLAASAVGAPGTAGDIAAAVEFLTGPSAGYVTGTDLLVDGGVVAGVRTGGWS